MQGCLGRRFHRTLRPVREIASAQERNPRYLEKFEHGSITRSLPDRLGALCTVNML